MTHITLKLEHTFQYEVNKLAILHTDKYLKLKPNTIGVNTETEKDISKNGICLDLGTCNSTSRIEHFVRDFTKLIKPVFLYMYDVTVVFIYMRHELVMLYKVLSVKPSCLSEDVP